MRKSFKVNLIICMLLAGGILAVSSFSSCNYALDSIEAPTWEPEILGPLAKSSMNIDALGTFVELDQRFEMYAADLGLPLGPVFPITTNMGPLDISLSNEIESITTDTIIMDIVLSNDMPFNVDPGMDIVIRDTVSSAVIYSKTLAYGIASGEVATEEIVLINTYLPSELKVFLENVEIVPEPGLPPVDNSHHFDVTATMKFNSMNRIVVKPGQLIDFQDTTAFELDLDEDGDLTGEGFFNILVDNSFPFGGSFQVYFLDETQSFVVDSLVTTAVGFTPPQISPDGTVSESTSSVLSIPISNEKIDVLADAAFTNFIFRLYSQNGSTGYVIDRESKMDFQLIADIKLTLEP